MSAAEALLRAEGLCKSYGQVTAVRPLDLAIAAGDFFAILGPSGCGKTTLLRMIGGFVAPSGGRLWIGGQDVTRLPPERRPTNMVFQGYGLFPHLSVRQNVGYGLKVARVPAAERARRVDEAMELVQIAPLAERTPDALSGGQGQRVALARALVMRPKVLLLDEPLAALDLKLRAAMQEELRALHREIGGTFVFVTHDQGEAMGLANRIAVMRDGAIEQEGSAEDLYLRPRSEFVATFVGEANRFGGERRGGVVRLRAGPSFADPGPDGPVLVVVRPEAVALDAEGLDVAMDGRLADVTFLGAHLRCRIRREDGGEVVAQLPGPGASGLAAGAPVRFGWRTGRAAVLAAGPGG